MLATDNVTRLTFHSRLAEASDGRSGFAREGLAGEKLTSREGRSCWACSPIVPATASDPTTNQRQALTLRFCLLRFAALCDLMTVLSTSSGSHAMSREKPVNYDGPIAQARKPKSIQLCRSRGQTHVTEFKPSDSGSDCLYFLVVVKSSGFSDQSRRNGSLVLISDSVCRGWVE